MSNLDQLPKTLFILIMGVEFQACCFKLLQMYSLEAYNKETEEIIILKQGLALAYFNPFKTVSQVQKFSL